MNPVTASRRGVLGAGLGASLIANTATIRPCEAAVDDVFGEANLVADIATYHRAGNKRTGGPGDNAVGDWLAERLARSDYAVERQMFTAPHIEVGRAEITIGQNAIPVLPLALSRATQGAGIKAPLRHVWSPGARAGTIAVIDLPFRRWSKADIAAIREPVRAAFDDGCLAAILITNGPTQQAIALNVPAKGPMFDRPVALLAPRDAKLVRDAVKSGQSACLQLETSSTIRPAFNIYARIKRADGLPWLTVSTPRSGWTACTAERGPGIAIWLALAEWATHACTAHNLLFVCNSGHEYENLGAGHLLDGRAPPPQETAFWLHLGANAAARDWHEIPDDLLPLPSGDPHRFLLVPDSMIEPARRIFAGQPGLEAAYPVGSGAAGELAEIFKAGYTSAAGVFGANRFHHVASDDMRTISPAVLGATARSFRALVEAALTHS